jgi:hypothetical protein
MLRRKKTRWAVSKASAVQKSFEKVYDAPDGSERFPAITGCAIFLRPIGPLCLDQPCN